MRIFVLTMVPVVCAFAQTPEMVRGVVDGKPVNQAQLEALVSLVPEQLRTGITGNEQELLRYYGFVTRMAEMAEKEKLWEQSPYKEQLELGRKTVLAIAEMSEYTKSLAITTPEADKYYEEHKDDFTTYEVTVAQVPVKSAADAPAAKTKAETLWKQLQGGANFAAMAKQYPVDGDFRSFKKSDSIPQDIKDAVMALKPGAVSRPLAMPNGVFLIRLDRMTVKSAQEVRGDIVKIIQDGKFQAWMNGVRKSVVVGK